MARPGKPDKDVLEGSGDFLARWSRRKLEAREEKTHSSEPAAGAVQTGEAEVAAGPASPEWELTDADMPPLESLTAESDFTPFMSPGVSDGLRRLALRKLFGQPAFNVTDGLNDYDEDYTKFAGLGNVVTHEMKRMLKRELDGGEGEKPPADAPVAGSREADTALPEGASSPEPAAENTGSVDTAVDAVDDSDSHERDRPEDQVR